MYFHYIYLSVCRPISSIILWYECNIMEVQVGLPVCALLYFHLAKVQLMDICPSACCFTNAEILGKLVRHYWKLVYILKYFRSSFLSSFNGFLIFLSAFQTLHMIWRFHSWIMNESHLWWFYHSRVLILIWTVDNKRHILWKNLSNSCIQMIKSDQEKILYLMAYLMIIL